MREIDVPSDFFQHVTCIRHILTEGCVSSPFWYHLSELKALSYISHVQRLAQKAISVGILNSKFTLEIHRFIKKQPLGLYLEFSPLTLPKQLLAWLSGWNSADCFHSIHLHDHALLKLWVKRGDHHSDTIISLLLCWNVTWEAFAQGHRTNQRM